MLDAEQKNKGFLDAIQRKPEDVQIRQALAYRGQADYAKASDVLLDILKQNNTQLTAQIEAAKNFQEWAAGKDVEKLKKALFGSEPGPKGKNIIWVGANVEDAFLANGKSPGFAKCILRRSLAVGCLPKTYWFDLSCRSRTTERP